MLNNNLVLAYEEDFNTSSLSMDTLKTLAVSTFPDLSPNPVSVSMSDFSTLFIPEAAMGIQMQNNVIIITDQSVGDFEKRDVKRLLQLAKGVEGKVGRELTSYGYNFIYEVELESFNKIKESFNKFYKAESPVNLENIETLYGIPSIVLKTPNNVIRINFSTVQNPSKGDELNRVRIAGNVHHFSQSLVTDLGESIIEYRKHEAIISNYIDEVFKDS